MSIDEMMIKMYDSYLATKSLRKFLQYYHHGLFKLNSYVICVLSEPKTAMKADREPYKSGYQGMDLYISFVVLYGRTHVDVHITIFNKF